METASEHNWNISIVLLLVLSVRDIPLCRLSRTSRPEGLLRHLEKRKALEYRIIDEVFQKDTVIVKAKNYIMDDIVELL